MSSNPCTAIVPYNPINFYSLTFKKTSTQPIEIGTKLKEIIKILKECQLKDSLKNQPFDSMFLDFKFVKLSAKRLVSSLKSIEKIEKIKSSLKLFEQIMKRDCKSFSANDIFLLTTTLLLLSLLSDELLQQHEDIVSIHVKNAGSYTI